MDSENGFSDISTEEVIAALSKQLHPSKVIVFTDVDGVFDSDPKLNSKALMIPYIDRHNIREAIKYAGPSLKVDVTGGMRTKVISVYKAVRGSNTVGYILNGSKAGNVYRFLIGKKTRFTEIRW